MDKWFRVSFGEYEIYFIPDRENLYSFYMYVFLKQISFYLES